MRVAKFAVSVLNLLGRGGSLLEQRARSLTTSALRKEGWKKEQKVEIKTAALENKVSPRKVRIVKNAK